MKTPKAITSRMLVTFLVAISISPLVNAHPGHDHNHWMSDGLHAGIFLSAIVAISLSVFCFKKSRSTQVSYAKKKDNG